MDKYKVGGMVFGNINEAEKAEKELEVINKLRQRYDLNDKDNIKMILDKDIKFNTILGMSFLNDLKEKYNYQKKENADTNKIAKALRILAILELISGIILFFILDFGEFINFSVLISSAITFIFILGFSEIIQILHDIRNITRDKN